ncbi:MAG: hypothetical protein ACMVO5_09145 [Polymorphobacter sp.]|uniref:hypothetical protein n=1 Tax=Polymorphobacter sp. TaxID=1909290 RepID=UPI003A8530ED
MIWPVEKARQRVAIVKTWDLFPVCQKDPLHIRAIWGKRVPNPLPTKNITFTEAAYRNIADRKQAFENEALRLNWQGYNIYTCFNRIRPDFAGDEHNGLAVKDRDIIARRYILIDFDRDATSQPATDDEIDAVFAVAHRLEHDFFFDKGHDPITVCSGNGVHIYLPVNLPNDKAGKAMCQKVLKALATKYDTEAVKVDTSVYNAARITKVPGTIARKGIEVLDPNDLHDRYYRMASVVK